MDQRIAATQTAWDPTLPSTPGTGGHSFIVTDTLKIFYFHSADQLFSIFIYSSKFGTQSKRTFKKGEDVRPSDVPGPAEEMEKNQKILLWLMEGQKEMVQHKRSSYGSVV